MQDPAEEHAEAPEARARGLVHVSTYRRRVAAPLERVWENVLDWEHLPWLHRTSFLDIAHEASGRWGWRARIGLPPAAARSEILLELRIERAAQRYVARTLEGPGAGSEIWTRLAPQPDGRTDIEVEFHLPGVTPDQVPAVGRAFETLYARLWDEDEAMMVRRGAWHGRRPVRHPARGAPEEPDSLDLGSHEALRARLPLRLEFAGRPWRILELDGELIVHAGLCPHRLGPLDEAAPEGSRLRCPWHGYVFDLHTGRSCDGRGLRLERPPRLVVDASGRVRLVARAC